MTQRLLGIVLVHAIGACGGIPSPAGTDDAGTDDAGTDDAGTDDAGEMDAQIADAALPDAAPFDDAGGSSPLVVRLLNYVGAEPTNVAFVAFQDGEGPWQTVTGINGSYLYSVSHNRYGIVYACTSATAATVNVVYATPGEISLLRTQCPTDLPTVNISGTVTGIPNDGSSVSIVTSYEGSGTATYAAPTYNAMAYPGTQDIIARVNNASGNTTELLLARSQALVNGGVYDLDLGGSFVPEQHAVTIMGATGGESTSSNSWLITEGGARMSLYVDDAWIGAPASALTSGDIHLVQTLGASGSNYRNVFRYIRLPAGFTVTLPTLPAPPVVTFAAMAPYMRLTTTVTRTGYTQFYQLSSNHTNLWKVGATEGWLEAGDTDTFTFPELFTLSGWNSLWGLMPPGDTINWSLSAYDSNRTVADIWIESEYRGPLPGGTDGLEIRAARISGMSTP